MKPLFCFILSILLSLSTFAQIQINRSYYNVSRPNGGPVVQNDVLELRAVISVPNGTTISSLSYTDNIPNSTAYVAGSLKVVTNEGAIVGAIPNTGAYTDAAGDDRGEIVANAITVYMGTGATSAAGGTIVGGSTTPVFYNVATILMVTYRVTVTAAAGNTINTTGQFHYIKGGTAFNTNVAVTGMFIYSPYSCVTTGPTNYVTDENGGTFGSGTTQNRAVASANVTGYTFVNLNSGQPSDGNYSIVNNTSATDYSGASPAASDKVFTVWDIFGDHSGTGNSAAGNAPTASGSSGGYLLAVNGTYAPSTIFHTVVSGLLTNTIYTMSVWVRNNCPKCGCNPATGTAVGTPGVLPDISMNVNGFTFYNSGDLSYTGTWIQKNFTFTTAASGTVTFDIKNNAPGGGGNDFAIDDISVNQCLVVLPIGLESFTGHLTPQGVVLNWQTEAAATTQYFDVERSVDGTHFYSIGQVAASADTSRYDFTDQLLSSDGSAFFYRLRIYDQDGGNNYSNIIRVNTGNTTATLTTRLAPNPAHGNSTLYVWSGEAGTAQVSLWTSAGALVYSRETALTGGNNAVDIRLPDHLPTGIYLVKTVMGAQSATSRLVVE
jgi:hypothetical protein